MICATLQAIRSHRKTGGDRFFAPKKCRSRFFSICLGAALASITHAITLEEIKQIPNLTPDRFARLFRGFEYQFSGELQTPEQFLATRRGDCDDYAVLADLVLKEKGYVTRLISVQMPGTNHVVCYIQNTKTYLDYNNRSYFKRTEKSGSSLPEIASKVARSFGSPWTSVTEFSCTNGIKFHIRTEFK